MGKIFGTISAIFGVRLFAIPAGLLAYGFSDEAETANKTVRIAEKKFRVFFYENCILKNIIDFQTYKTKLEETHT